MAYKFKTTEQRSKIMQKIRSVDTKPEIFFRKRLRARGIRFSKNNRKLLGKPDIAISKYKVAVFIDGEFWHGYRWDAKRKKIKANRDYWIPKIERNITRDKKYTAELKKSGWAVIRFWSLEIKKKQEQCLNKVIKVLDKRGFRR